MFSNNFVCLRSTRGSLDWENNGGLGRNHIRCLTLRCIYLTRQCMLIKVGLFHKRLFISDVLHYESLFFTSYSAKPFNTFLACCFKHIQLFSRVSFIATRPFHFIFPLFVLTLKSSINFALQSSFFFFHLPSLSISPFPSSIH